MDTLNNILEEIKNGPTIMEIENEISYFSRLQQFSKQDILAEFLVFQQILGELMISQMDNYYAINEHNISSFNDFSDWLKQLASYTSGKDSLTLQSYADDFAANLKELKQSSN